MPYPYDDGLDGITDPEQFWNPEAVPQQNEFVPQSPVLTPESQAGGGRFHDMLRGLDVPSYRHRIGGSRGADFWGSLLAGAASGMQGGAQRVYAQRLADIRQKNAEAKGKTDLVNRANLLRFGAGLKPQGSIMTITGPDGVQYHVPTGSAVGQKAIGRATGLTPAPAAPEMVEGVTDPTTGKPLKVTQSSSVGQTILKGRLKLGGTPKPPAGPKRINTQSWHILSPDDESGIKALEDKIKTYANDPVRMRALQPPATDSKGVPRKEPQAVMQVRADVEGLRGQIKAARRSAYSWHLAHLPEDPQDAQYVWHQVATDATRNGLVRMGKDGFVGDPALAQALNDAADRMEKAKK